MNTFNTQSKPISPSAQINEGNSSIKPIDIVFKDITYAVELPSED
jgi:hypothetical protein